MVYFLAPNEDALLFIRLLPVWLMNCSAAGVFHAHVTGSLPSRPLRIRKYNSENKKMFPEYPKAA